MKHRTIYNTPIIYPLLCWLSKKILKFFKWQIIGEPPSDKMVCIGAPHTSNWDFPIGLAAIFSGGWVFYWVGKHTLFKPPLGVIMRWLGGIPIDRSQSHNTVDAYIKLFNEHDKLTIVMTPEGTRSPKSKWKSGFYHIAHGAKVPISLAFLDFEKKQAGFGQTVIPSGDFEKDMDTIREFYKDKIGRVPENFRLPE